MSPNTLPTDEQQFHEALLRWARTYDPLYVAAVQLLIDAEHWTRRADFRRHTEAVHEETAEAPVMVGIDWVGLCAARDAGTFTASSSELAVLDIALSMGCGRPVDLQRAFINLGPAYREYVSYAVQTSG